MSPAAAHMRGTMGTGCRSWTLVQATSHPTGKALQLSEATMEDAFRRCSPSCTHCQCTALQDVTSAMGCLCWSHPAPGPPACSTMSWQHNWLQGGWGQAQQCHCAAQHANTQVSTTEGPFLHQQPWPVLPDPPSPYHSPTLWPVLPDPHMDPGIQVQHQEHTFHATK